MQLIVVCFAGGCIISVGFLKVVVFMPIQLLLSDGDPLELSFFENGSDAVVTSQVVYDNELNVTYSTFCCLSPVIGADDRSFELAFFVIEKEHETGYEYNINNGLDTKNKIVEAEQRAAVLSAIICSIDILIEKISPNVVTMITYNANLPDKALKKYSDIMSLFRQRGYTGGPTDPYYGRTCWLMQRYNK